MKDTIFQRVVLKTLVCLLKASMVSYEETAKIRQARNNYLKATATMLEELIIKMEDD